MSNPNQLAAVLAARRERSALQEKLNAIKKALDDKPAVTRIMREQLQLLRNNVEELRARRDEFVRIKETLQREKSQGQKEFSDKLEAHMSDVESKMDFSMPSASEEQSRILQEAELLDERLTLQREKNQAAINAAQFELKSSQLRLQKEVDESILVEMEVKALADRLGESRNRCSIMERELLSFKRSLEEAASSFQRMQVAKSTQAAQLQEAVSARIELLSQLEPLRVEASRANALADDLKELQQLRRRGRPQGEIVAVRDGQVLARTATTLQKRLAATIDAIIAAGVPVETLEESGSSAIAEVLAQRSKQRPAVPNKAPAKAAVAPKAAPKGKQGKRR